MAKVTKIGNSLGVEIPRKDLEALGLKEGDDVTIRRRGRHLEITPAVLRPDVQHALDRTVGRYEEALGDLAT